MANFLLEENILGAVILQGRMCQNWFFLSSADRFFCLRKLRIGGLD